MNLIELLQAQARERPEAAAIIEGAGRSRRVTTFAGLDRASARLAGRLARAGLRPGQAVLIFQPLSAELYMALAAVFRLGLIAVFLDPGQGRSHLEQSCALYPPQALIASPKAHLLRLVSPGLRRIPHKFLLRRGGRLQRADWGRLSIRPAPSGATPPPTAKAPALLTFTSGSTGQPKAALRSHAFLLAQYQALTPCLELAAGQIDLATLPVVALANLASGVTSLIPQADLRYPGRIEPGPVVAQLQAEQAQSIVASPALLERLASYCQTEEMTLPALQKIFSGGAPVFPSLLERVQEMAPQAQVWAIYGATEAEPMAKIGHHQLQPIDIAAMQAGQGLLAGRPVETIRLRIMKQRWGVPVGPFSQADFEATWCPAGTPGEIVVSGAHVLPGYLHGQGDAESKIDVAGERWHRTGDAGYLDDQGRLWLLGRGAARLEDERGALYPLAVECALSFWPGIRRGAVAARENRRVLAVEVEPGASAPDPAAIRAALPWAQVDAVHFLPRIPVDKRHNAKVDYPALGRLVAEVER